MRCCIIFLSCLLVSLSSFGQSITGFSPRFARPGAQVRIDGSGFVQNGTAVFFNGVQANATVVSVQPGQIVAFVPANATTGPITVRTAQGTAFSAENFVVLGNGPYIDTFTPSTGAAGTQITLNGAQFNNITGVTIGGVSASFQPPTTSERLIVTAPAGVVTGEIIVNSSQGSAGSRSLFYVPPGITSFSPESGRAGTNVLVNGVNFIGASSVTFNNLNANFVILNNAQIQATVPFGATTGPIRVVAPGGTTPLTNSNFRIEPTIQSFNPIAGGPSTPVAIFGANFIGTPTVTFNGVSASSVALISSSELRAIVPQGATIGPIAVTTTGGTATSQQLFYIPPFIRNFSPTNGSGGTMVVINGTNFLGATSVLFNGANASFFVENNNVIQAGAPNGVTTGPITVVGPAGNAVSTNLFYAPPFIIGFNPGTGGAGTTVTITGGNFQGATAVRFNGLAASFTVNGNQITAQVPSNAITGPITVVAPGGSATSAATFYATPSITSFTPTTAAPGTTVQITGINLLGATAVSFNGQPAANFTVQNNSNIVAVVPGAVTTGPIQVTTPAGTATSAGNFFGPPQINSFTPANGRRGTNVVITGLNFISVTAVRFNGAPATFTVVSPTEIRATVPANATTGPITVTTASGTATSVGAFTIDPSSDLALVVFQSANQIQSTGQLTYTITITNLGPSDAPNVSLTNFMDVRLQYVSGTTTHGSISTHSNIVVVNLGYLVADSVATVRLTARAVGEGSITNFARVSHEGGFVDTNPNNNQATTIGFIIPVVKLNIRRAGDVLEITWSASLTDYVLEFSPNVDGPWDAADVPIQQEGEIRKATVVPAGNQGYFRLKR